MKRRSSHELTYHELIIFIQAARSIVEAWDKNCAPSYFEDQIEQLYSAMRVFKQLKGSQAQALLDRESKEDPASISLGAYRSRLPRGVPLHPFDCEPGVRVRGVTGKSYGRVRLPLNKLYKYRKGR